MNKEPIQIGIDIGGTFTDFVIHSPANRKIETFKLLSTPDDPAEAVLRGLKKIFTRYNGQHATIIHGSTVATNALLERKGARTALVTTGGFRDVLEIGRQNRPALYDFFADPLPPLVPAGLRYEVNERVTHTGEVLQEPNRQDMELLVKELKTSRAQSVAVCLLFSFLEPKHEQIICGRLRAEGFLASSSSDILPEYREYERTSTTVVNAYVSPVLEKYLGNLEKALVPGMAEVDGEVPGLRVNLRVMQSNGGNISLEEARKFGVRCILSGPAGGVIGCEYVGRQAVSSLSGRSGEPEEHDKRIRLITFDMGGTSTDVSLIDNKAQITTEAIVGGCPIRIPMLDIHTIGAGGGSIAQVDAGGALRVGPESAGADPGPACYGKGKIPTVTDANLILGRLAAEHFLGGEMPLNTVCARQALDKLGKDLNLDATRAALGVVQVANAHMERALRVITVERGRDPRLFSLLAFGGAGGLHAADLARNLGIPRVLVPRLASTLSAFGMLAAEVVKDYTLTVMLGGETPIRELEARLDLLAERGHRELEAEGVDAGNVRIERYLDMRYRGQSYELIVPYSRDFFTDFHKLHLQNFGYAQDTLPVEIVNLRLRSIGRVEPPPLEISAPGGADPTPALLTTREVIFAEGILPTPFYRAELLKPGNLLNGPAVIVRTDTTILLGPADTAEMDAYENILIEVGR